MKLKSATFSADGKFLVTRCDYDHIYIWDVSAILKEAGLPSDNVVLCTFPPSYLVSKRIVWHAPLLSTSQPICAMSTRTHHAGGNPSGSTQPAYTYVIPTGPLQVTESSSQQPPATAATPTGLVAMGPSSHPGIITTPSRAGWWTRFLLWICCVSSQHTDGQR
ncbi:hypothetical protein BDR03DRAFT_947922 [Suillus americanus]|nr:hypothetical protein BDR03DRAFT_947922 [Suillus americanus]